MPCATPFLPFRVGWAFRFSRKNFRAQDGAGHCQKRISAADAGPPESIARGGRGLCLPAAIRGNAHDVIPASQVPHRDHRRTGRRDRRQRAGRETAEGDAARRRDPRAGGRAHGALFYGGRDCEDGGGGADGGWSVINRSSPRLLRIALDPRLRGDERGRTLTRNKKNRKRALQRFLNTEISLADATIGTDFGSGPA